jgi:hypothetical protein
MSLYTASVPQLTKMLKSLESWLDKAAAHAKEKGFDPELYLGFRLAPDQYPLLKQIQAACDSAKFVAARLGGKEAPKHPDTEQTLSEIRARIQAVLTFLGTFGEADIAGNEDKLLELPFLEGKVIRAEDYLTEFALPNFYFHVTTAYAILRHNGVSVGKRDFIGGMTVRDK